MVNFSVKPPSSLYIHVLFVHVENFSIIYAASPRGELSSPTPENIIFLK